MDFDRKDALSYLDGVPVKISAKFWPPRPVSLPLACDAELPTDLLSEQYDFSLERNVLELYKKREAELEEAQARSSSKDVASKNGSTSNISLKDSLKQNVNTDSVSVLKPNSQHVFSWQPNIILQPKPQQTADKISNNDETKNIGETINLSDFENDTSSPFDLMELKTINDFEELSSVFQGLNDKYSPKDNMSIEDSTNMSIRSAAKNETAGNVSKSISFPLPQNSEYICTDKILSSSSGALLCGSDSNSLPLADSKDDGRLSFSYPTVADLVGGSNSGSRERVLNYSSDISSYTALSQVPYISSQAGISGNEMVSMPKPVLRGCKSYSDIRSLSELGTVDYREQERSRTPPSTMVSTAVTEPLVRKLAVKSDHSNYDNAASNGVLNCDNSCPSSICLPDPYEELNDDAKQVVDSIFDMGFSRGQVARAVKHLGMDEKKVVEHLCQIQVLEESGYDCLEAEAALHLHDYNRDQAKKFLDLVSKFQDLGFEKNAVKKALVQNKNDWNKTIDSLLP